MCVCVCVCACVLIYKIVRISKIKTELLRKAHTIFLCFFFFFMEKLVLYLGFSRLAQQEFPPSKCCNSSTAAKPFVFWMITVLRWWGCGVLLLFLFLCDLMIISSIMFGFIFLFLYMYLLWIFGLLIVLCLDVRKTPESFKIDFIRLIMCLHHTQSSVFLNYFKNSSWEIKKLDANGFHNL